MAEDKKPDGSAGGTTPPQDDKVSKAEVEKQIGELRSVKDKEIAGRERTIAELTEQLETLKSASDGDTKVAQGKLEQVIARERKLVESEGVVTKRERELTARELAAEYSVPADELLKSTDIKDMRIKALELYTENLKKVTPGQNNLQRPPMDRSGSGGVVASPKGTFDALLGAMVKHKAEVVANK